jgi:rhodanese-related sulfurtransferase
MPTIIDRAEVQRMLRDGARVVEVLAADEYAEEHLPGAANLPLAELSPATAARFDPLRPIIVYCYDLE